MVSTPLDLDMEKGDINSSEDQEVLSESPRLQDLAELHLASLSPYTKSKNGTYILNALKVVTGSESFLGQSEERKGCGNEEFEVCQSRRYLVAVEQQCDCVPWLATFFLEHKVTAFDLLSLFDFCLQIFLVLLHPTFKFKPLQIKVSHQNFTTCSPDAFNCYKSLAKNDFGCREPCTGLYAGVAPIFL